MDDAEPNIVIAGYAKLFGSLVDDQVLKELRTVGESADNIWGALFIYDRDDDGNRRKWTLITADHNYAQMLAARVGRIELSSHLVQDKFPAFIPGWVLDDDSGAGSGLAETRDS